MVDSPPTFIESSLYDLIESVQLSVTYPVRDEQEEELKDLIVDIFKKSRQNYGGRKIKVELKKLGWTVSRRRIRRIMKEQGLVSKYTVAQFNRHYLHVMNQ